TRINGKFSLDLGETLVPFAAPVQARTAGKLAVHELTIGPGPLIQNLALLVERVEALRKPRNLLQSPPSSRPTRAISMKDQQIEFHVAERRVHHRNLEFVVDNVPVRSNGSVGFDQTLALTIEIPVQDKWIDGEPALRSLA